MRLPCPSFSWWLRAHAWRLRLASPVPLLLKVKMNSGVVNTSFGFSS